MKKVLLYFWVLIMPLFSFGQNSAPSSHIGANDYASGDIIMKSVRSTITTTSTYYCTMQWNAGGEGGAYCGFQDSSVNGHQFIYSIWDPSNGEPITAVYRPDGTTVQNFGGEGTGLKSENQIIGWDLNKWNTLVSRRWDVGDHTYFGFWIRRDSKDKWYHMVTMDYPVANVTFNGSTNAFLEDWLSSGANTRRFEMKDAFKRKLDDTWLPMTQGNFSVNSGDITSGGRSENYASSYDADENNGVFAMQIGGSTTPSFSGTTRTLTTSTYASEPQNPAISFSITGAATNNVIWEVPESSTPQFKFTVKVNDVTVGSEIEPEIRHFNLSASAGDNVEVTLEDILGRTSTISTTVAAGTIDDPIATDYTLADGTYKITGVESGKVIAPTSANQWTQIANYNGTESHQWVLYNQGNDDYIIKNANYTSQSLDAFVADSKVGMYQSHNEPVGSNQKWYLTHIADGKYKITSVGTGKVANVSGTTNGSNIDLISPYTGEDSQLFTFTNLDETLSTNTPNKYTGLFKFYPNPASKTLNVFIDNQINKSEVLLELYTLTGSLVSKKLVKVGLNKELNISNLSSGLYILRSEGVTQKIIIK
ncbi:DUF3472 domain-containing protein [Aestuariibaculum sp. YM273]|uniref:DUF3472 domain-containing protein n=1 Tax=Aestuariibaculum sp. YM273 TaxID=3070659 RepID=UPI0027DCF1B8|nr:DUF3472 domain-containing protein [Aestuariibaculum sp. YM273]WMI66824.1 DUF3472 domain-containing protein [Aestuariibaculum sp. YM273]